MQSLEERGPAVGGEVDGSGRDHGYEARREEAVARVRAEVPQGVAQAVHSRSGRITRKDHCHRQKDRRHHHRCRRRQSPPLLLLLLLILDFFDGEDDGLPVKLLDPKNPPLPAAAPPWCPATVGQQRRP